MGKPASAAMRFSAAIFKAADRWTNQHRDTRHRADVCVPFSSGKCDWRRAAVSVLQIFVTEGLEMPRYHCRRRRCDIVPDAESIPDPFLTDPGEVWDGNSSAPSESWRCRASPVPAGHSWRAGQAKPSCDRTLPSVWRFFRPTRRSAPMRRRRRHTLRSSPGLRISATRWEIPRANAHVMPRRSSSSRIPWREDPCAPHERSSPTRMAAAERLREMYPESRDKIHLIRNGFDPEARMRPGASFHEQPQTD